MAQVKYWQDGAAVGWNKIQHVNVEWLWSLSTAQQCHCQCRPNSTCTRARSLYFLRIWIWTNTFPVSARPAPITFVNSGGRLTLIRRRHSFTPSWCRMSIIAMRSSPRLRRQQQTGYNECETLLHESSATPRSLIRDYHDWCTKSYTYGLRAFAVAVWRCLTLCQMIYEIRLTDKRPRDKRKATGQKATDERPQNKRPLRQKTTGQKATERNVMERLLSNSL